MHTRGLGKKLAKEKEMEENRGEEEGTPIEEVETAITTTEPVSYTHLIITYVISPTGFRFFSTIRMAD